MKVSMKSLRGLQRAIDKARAAIGPQAVTKSVNIPTGKFKHIRRQKKSNGRTVDTYEVSE